MIEDEGGHAINVDELVHEKETDYLKNTMYLQLNNFTGFTSKPTVLWKSGDLRLKDLDADYLDGSKADLDKIYFAERKETLRKYREAIEKKLDAFKAQEYVEVKPAVDTYAKKIAEDTVAPYLKKFETIQAAYDANLDPGRKLVRNADGYIVGPGGVLTGPGEGGGGATSSSAAPDDGEMKYDQGKLEDAFDRIEGVENNSTSQMSGGSKRSSASKTSKDGDGRKRAKEDVYDQRANLEAGGVDVVTAAM